LFEMPLPTFLLCGAPKAGTTSLYRYVAEHPDVCMSAEKETGFFLENYDEGLDWLSSTHYRHYDDETAVGESTTGMMASRKAPERIARDLPDARLLFILRDPVDRIYSHFDFHRSAGVLPADASFSSIIRDEASEWRATQIDLGRYHDHLTRYEQHFDRDQMLVLLFDDLKSRPEAVMQRTYAFLGIDPTYTPNTDRRHNASQQPRSTPVYHALRRVWEPIKEHVGVYVLQHTEPVRHALRNLLMTDADRAPMTDADRAYLRDLYAAPNVRLARWLDADLSHWT
jgi:hypothetical protein